MQTKERNHSLSNQHRDKTRMERLHGAFKSGPVSLVKNCHRQQWIECYPAHDTFSQGEQDSNTLPEQREKDCGELVDRPGENLVSPSNDKYAEQQFRNRCSNP